MAGRATAMAAAALGLAAAIAAPAGAAGEPPRQVYSDVFSTETPGASAGRAIAIDWADPRDPEGKPPSFSHLRIELADGAHFDTSAVAQCHASDVELMVAGASACPAEARLGVDEILVDSGTGGSARYFTADIVFFNADRELILLSTVREYGTRVVLRGRVGANTVDIDVPLLPGTPPDGGAPKRERGTYLPRTSLRDGREVAYLTTPPACPDTGYWVNRITYTYRDGIEQTAESRSPCTRAAAPGERRQRLEIGVTGLPRRCVSRSFVARVAVTGASAVRRVRVRLDGRQIASTRRGRFRLRVPVRRLRAGRHTVSVTAADAAGGTRTRTFRFRRCSG